MQQQQQEGLLQPPLPLRVQHSSNYHSNCSQCHSLLEMTTRAAARWSSQVLLVLLPLQWQQQ
jgi:hypothetical protein